MKRLGTLFTAATVAFAGTLLVPTTSGTASTPTTAEAAVPAPRAGGSAKDRKLRVIQANLDGGKVAAVLKQARKFAREKAGGRKLGVDALMLQEVCASQIPQLEAAGYTFVENPFIDNKCEGGGMKYGGIATKRRYTELDPIPLGVHGGRTFTATCIKLHQVGVRKAVLCTTHLALSYGKKGKPGYVDGKAVRAEQVRILTTTLNAWIRQGNRVILTGDFNMPPKEDTMRQLYKAQGQGKFYEGDQHWKCSRKAGCRSMRPTTDRKRKKGKLRRGRPLDYFMVSKNGTRSRSLGKRLRGNPYAEHKIVLGEATFR